MGLSNRVRSPAKNLSFFAGYLRLAMLGSMVFVPENGRNHGTTFSGNLDGKFDGNYNDHLRVLPNSGMVNA